MYLDDILVFGPDFKTMLARLESVLDRLGGAGLKLKAKKCQLFLGHIVSAAGIGADPAKCEQVRDWPVPRDLHEVRSFVGLCSYYRRHIQGFTELAAPLYELATKGTDFKWTERRNETEYTPQIRRGPDGGVTPVRVPEAYGAGRLGGQVGRR